MMWIKVKEVGYNNETLINLENVSVINVQSNTIVVNAIHGQGNGVIHLESGECERIARIILCEENLTETEI